MYSKLNLEHILLFNNYTHTKISNFANIQNTPIDTLIINQHKSLNNNVALKKLTHVISSSFFSNSLVIIHASVTE